VSFKVTKDNSEELLQRLIAAIGKDAAGDAERAWFEERFRMLKQGYLKRLPPFESDVDYRELLGKFLVNGEERRELRRQLTAMKYELWRIRRIRLNATHAPDDKSRFILSALTDPDIIARFELEEERDIQTYLEMATDYRKGAIRKLAIEPFLVLLQNEDVVASRERPLNHMVKALLDFLGVDPKRRPTDPGIRAIAREIKDKFEKRPAQRPVG
jgi:hypothetical protein